MQKITGNFFIFFLGCHYGFANCFEILNFVFLIYLEELQPINTKLSVVSISSNLKLKVIKFSFLAFSGDFFKILPSKFMAV